MRRLPAFNMLSFNLITQPWIPVLRMDGSPVLVSLQEAFANGANYRDLDCTPHERVALTRLLVCVMQAALGAPKSAFEWGAFGDVEQVGCYLSRADVLAGFEMFGSGRRFLQMGAEVAGKNTPIAKLFMHLATGNNPTWQDHAGGEDIRSFPCHTLALALLTFQNFYPSYGAGYLGQGPCSDSNMLHTLLCGNNLLEMVVLNCLSEDYIFDYYPMRGMGRPIWELDAALPEHIEIATGSYLGRLVPQHRLLRMTDDGFHFVLNDGAIQYPRFEEFREPSATVTVAKRNGADARVLLPARLGRGAWRDLSIVAVKREHMKEETRGPLPLQIQFARAEGDISIWTGALITKNAKILDSVEALFTLPTKMFSNEGYLRYQSGVDFAEKWGTALYYAVTKYCEAMGDSNALRIQSARSDFWGLLDQRSVRLFDAVRGDGLEDDFGRGRDPWTEAVKASARIAYEQACPCGNARQIQAFAAGETKLFLKPQKT